MSPAAAAKGTPVAIDAAFWKEPVHQLFLPSLDGAVEREHLLNLHVRIAGGEVAEEVCRLRAELLPAAILEELHLLRPVMVVLDQSVRYVVVKALVEHIGESLWSNSVVLDKRSAAFPPVLEAGIIVSRHARRAPG
eukprot:CAMPEP_0171191120 /NCGR_PEP_ID=MMETSP0790-20130122/19202_1 /TAXON_ID=2925 /ORGANISM="Alexandrium catenella, Strain OF101" /LENGTH=135 /DNA_ID=CAMNT_0011656261 /DNA_START=97 /DNA_END=505 /DNA_ORIENTATION=-